MHHPLETIFTGFVLGVLAVLVGYWLGRSSRRDE